MREKHRLVASPTHPNQELTRFPDMCPYPEPNQIFCFVGWHPTKWGTLVRAAIIPIVVPHLKAPEPPLFSIFWSLVYWSLCIICVSLFVCWYLFYLVILYSALHASQVWLVSVINFRKFSVIITSHVSHAFFSLYFSSVLITCRLYLLKKISHSFWMFGSIYNFWISNIVFKL